MFQIDPQPMKDDSAVKLNVQRQFTNELDQSLLGNQEPLDGP